MTIFSPIVVYECNFPAKLGEKFHSPLLFKPTQTQGEHTMGKRFSKKRLVIGIDKAKYEPELLKI